MTMHVGMMSLGEKGANSPCTGPVEKIEQTKEPSECAVIDKGRRMGRGGGCSGLMSAAKKDRSEKCLLSGFRCPQ